MTALKKWIREFVPKRIGNFCLYCLFSDTHPDMDDHDLIFRLFAKEKVNLKHVFEVNLTEKLKEIGVDPQKLAKLSRPKRGLSFSNGKLTIEDCYCIDTLYEDIEKLQGKAVAL